MSVATRRVFPGGFLFRTVALLVAYTLARGIFFHLNESIYKTHSFSSLVEAFLMGLRYDAWLVSCTMLPLFFLELNVWRTPTVARARAASLFSLVIVFLHSILLFLEIADGEYFAFTGRRSNVAVLGILSSDGLDQSLQILGQFWHVPLLSLTLSVLLIVVWQKTRHVSAGVFLSFSRFRFLLTFFIGVVIGVLGIRGGLQTKPLASAHAMQLGDSQLAALALNTSFQLMQSLEREELPRIGFFNSDHEAENVLRVPSKSDSPVHLDQYNVVVLIVESLSLEYTGYKGFNQNYTPFLTELAERSFTFENAYANGRQSIDALPSILSGLPSLLGQPFVTSQYSTVRLPSLGHTLSDFGYSSVFFHGAKNGSMHIDSMARLFGFKSFFGRSEYPRTDADYDGTWGIFDEPFLQFSIEKINEQKRPFVAGLFTLSSHNPYRIPEHLENEFDSGKHPFHRSLAYTDAAIRKFFETASRQDWYKNTLFVITADHTAELVESEFFMGEQGLFRVPVMFFDPSGQLPAKKSERLVQHVDIFPTVLDLLGIDSSRHGRRPLPFGQSVFLPEAHARAANAVGDWLWYQEGKKVIRIPRDGSSAVEVRELAENTLTAGAGRAPTEEELTGIVMRARAYLQVFNNRLLDNTLSP
jgi:phosphoglycerol transferase MdoB-like AlkP superfamily enzyme